MVDELIEEGAITSNVLAQVGHSSYTSVHYKSFNFKPESEMNRIMESIDILITHAGVGSITTALQLQKKVIVVPRLKKNGEHVDDHQIEIAKAYHQKGYIAVAQNKDELTYILKNIDDIKFQQYIPEKSTILNSIQDFISSI